MIKVTVMYPNTPGARFNHEYYRDKHMPLLKARMGESCKNYAVDRGLAGGTPDAPAPLHRHVPYFLRFRRGISEWLRSTCARIHGRHSAAFLFLFGTGPIKGFAVTLVIGLMSNMFTAVFVSRTLFEWALARQKSAARISI